MAQGCVGFPGLPSPGRLPPPPGHLPPCLPERAHRMPLLALTTETRARQPWKASWKSQRLGGEGSGGRVVSKLRGG